jgi:hypothetical protein
VRVRLEVDVAASTIRDVRVALGRPEVGVAQHLLDRAKVGSALQEMGRERVAEEVRVHASGLEAGAIRELAENEERPGARQRTTPCVQEELRAVSAVEVWTPECEVSPHGLRGRPPERDQALLASLAEDADHSLVEGDATLLESDRLGHAQAGSVQKLDERTIA